MELRQLKYFIKAAELENFTEASAASFITQSTLSQQIKQLEDELGIPLFHRIAKRVRLTEAGKMFLPYAIKTLKDANDGKDILKDLMDLNTGTLTIGVTYGLTNLLTQAIAKFSEDHPNIKFDIVFGTTQDLLEKLDRNSIEMMLSFSQEEKNGSYKTEKLFSSSLALIVHQNHALSPKKELSLKHLENVSLILPSVGFSIRNYLDELLSRQNIKPDMLMEINDINMILQLVGAGKLATVLMASSIFNYPQLKAIKITGNGMTRQATIKWPAEAYRKKSARLLAQLLTDFSKDYQS
ncbi:LysR substrate-binding domain-containing protein [Mucilaginibacter auburnensis]|uniref:LysR family cyn operon transcriptional activator n=1 Tax=Mucilaginibacter auburnensis TaxID=1457233 RepID=A0A2H9VNY3_9SPHI|nr:LysR substrate-binding domain-containing protein [Mucilaginibacter auburnensis]PJJ80013.1 LysR family cyn operon transcriptional activator [Mucilaginibacter auburnensis]